MHKTNSITREQLVLNLAGSLSLTAALIHAMVMPEHFQEWWGYGLFFFAVTLVQAVYGVGLLVHGWGSSPLWVAGTDWKYQLPAFYAAGIVGNLAIIGMYLVTRTSGIPLGPHAGDVEAFSALSVLSTLLEVALVGCLMFLLADARHRPPSRRQQAES